MKRTKSMIVKETEESRELYLYAINDGDIYRQSIVPIVRNLAKKYSKGQFDADKAVDAFYYAAEAAAKKYCREFARTEDAPSVFNVTARFTCASAMVDYYMENIENNDL